jgi:hypothetical protein
VIKFIRDTLGSIERDVTTKKARGHKGKEVGGRGIIDQGVVKMKFKRNFKIQCFIVEAPSVGFVSETMIEGLEPPDQARG